MYFKLGLLYYYDMLNQRRHCNISDGFDSTNIHPDSTSSSSSSSSSLQSSSTLAIPMTTSLSSTLLVDKREKDLSNLHLMQRFFMAILFTTSLLLTMLYYLVLDSKYATLCTTSMWMITIGIWFLLVHDLKPAIEKTKKWLMVDLVTILKNILSKTILLFSYLSPCCKCIYRYCCRFCWCYRYFSPYDLRNCCFCTFINRKGGEESEFKDRLQETQQDVTLLEIVTEE